MIFHFFETLISENKQTKFNNLAPNKRKNQNNNGRSNESL
jgi:hypothetical protein